MMTRMVVMIIYHFCDDQEYQNSASAVLQVRMMMKSVVIYNKSVMGMRMMKTMVWLCVSGEGFLGNFIITKLLAWMLLLLLIVIKFMY